MNNAFYALIGATLAGAFGFILSAGGFFTDQDNLWGSLSIIGGIASVVAFITLVAVKTMYFDKSSSPQSGTRKEERTEHTTQSSESQN